MCYTEWFDLKSTLYLGFNTGNLQVRILHTAPIPVDTIPVVGAGTHQPMKSTVSYETRGTTSTCGFILNRPPYNLVKAHTRQLTYSVPFTRYWDGWGGQARTYLHCFPLSVLPSSPPLSYPLHSLSSPLFLSPPPLLSAPCWWWLSS